MTITPLEAGGLAIVGLIVGYLVRIGIAKKIQNSIERKAEEELEAAKGKTKEIELEAKNRATVILSEAQKDERERKQELRRLEERLTKKEDVLDSRAREFDTQLMGLSTKENKLKEAEEEVKVIHEKAVVELERVAGLSREEAKRAIFEELETSYRKELTTGIVRLERERRDAIEAKGMEILETAIQRYARNSTWNGYGNV